MNKHIGVGDETWVANVVNQFQGNVTVLDGTQAVSALAEAFVRNLPQIISHPEVLAHLREVAKAAVRDNESLLSEGDVETIVRRMWSEAEPEISRTLTTLVADSRDMVQRVFIKQTPDFRHEEVNVKPFSREIFTLTMDAGDLLELTACQPQWMPGRVTTAWSLLSFKLLDPSGKHVPTDSFEVRRTLTISASVGGDYSIEFSTNSIKPIKVEFEYRVIPSTHPADRS